MADCCPCSGWRPAGYLDSDQLSVLEKLHSVENVLNMQECRQLGTVYEWEWWTLLPLIVISKPRSCQDKALTVLQNSELELKDVIINNLLMLVKLQEMGILNHKEIEEMKKMEVDLLVTLAVILCGKDSDIIKSAEVVTKHECTDFGKYLLVIAELKGLDSLSVEEAIAVWENYRWEANLVSVAATKDSRTVQSIASVMDTHGYSEECKVLKVMAKLKGLDYSSVEEAIGVWEDYIMAELKGLNYFSVEEAIAVWKDYREWEVNLVPVAATKDIKTVKSIASVMDTHGYSEKCKVLKVMAELKALNCLSVEETIAVWKDYWRWEANLVLVAATKDSKTVISIASVMDAHGYSRECKVLKVMVELKALIGLSVEEAITVWKDYSEWVLNLVPVAATKDSWTVKSMASVMDTHGYSRECKVLEVMSRAYQLVKKSEHWKEDGWMRPVLALYWTLLHSEDDRVKMLKGSQRMTDDTLVHKLQVVGSLVMRMLEDPLYQNIEPRLSVLKGGLGNDWYFNLNTIIEGLLEPYNPRGPGVADKLRVLILCYWSGLISDEECERVYSLDDPECRSQLEALQNEDINDVLHGRWWKYIYRQADKHMVQLLFTEKFQSKLMEAAIDKGGSVEVEIVKVVTLGPPESGKTQLKKALTGQFENSTQSTLVSTEADVVMECFIEEESKFAWKQFDSTKLQSSLCATVEKDMYDTSHSQFHTAQKGTSMGKGQVPLPVARKEYLNTEPVLEPEQASVEGEVVHSKQDTTSPTTRKADLPIESEFSALTKRVVRRYPQEFGDKYLKKVKLIHMIDSGGQPAFLDFHPLVATSRALYLLVYNSQEGLLACPALTYRKPTEFPTKSLPNPSQTNLAMIKRSLHSLHHCKDKLLKMEGTMRDRLGENVTIDPSDVLPIIVVGSRKAQQCQEDPSSLLKSHCCSIPIWDDTQPNVVLVDSLTPSCSGVKELRETISKTESKFKIRFPLLWFHCQLMFWSTDDPSLSVLTYHHLRMLCMKHKFVSSGEEFLALITTFHMLGLFVCSGIDRIREDPNDSDSLYNSPIFTKPNVLYQQISKILEIPFRDLESPKCNLTPAQRKSFKDIQREGIISAVSLHLLGVPDTLGSFTGFHSYLLQSLVKWGLAAQVSQDLGLAAQVSQDPLQLFIPSVLPTRSEAHRALSQSPIPQLAFTIIAEKSKEVLTTITEESDDSYHLPQGLFSHFIVSLIEHKGGGYEVRKGRGKAEPRCRDVMTLTKDVCQKTEFPYTICTVDSIDHISVHIVPGRKDEKGQPKWDHRDCAIIVRDMKQCMEEAYSRLYQRSTQSQVILCCLCTCDLAKDKKHLARVDCERLTLRCLSLEHVGVHEQDCQEDLKAILTETGCLKDKPLKKDANMVTKEAGGNRSPPSEEDDVQPSHQHQHPVASTPKVTQRKREPHKLPTSASKKTDNKTSLKDKPLQKDLNKAFKEAGGNSSPPSGEDDVQLSHPTSSKSPEHQHPVLSTPKDFMEHFYKEFFEDGVVDGETIAEKLANEKVISERLKKKLAKEDDEYKITSAIFNHIKKQGDYESLEALCTIMKNEGGMKKMNKLGKKMLDCLVANKDNFPE